MAYRLLIKSNKQTNTVAPKRMEWCIVLWQYMLLLYSNYVLVLFESISLYPKRYFKFFQVVVDIDISNLTFQMTHIQFFVVSFTGHSGLGHRNIQSSRLRAQRIRRAPLELGIRGLDWFSDRQARGRWWRDRHWERFWHVYRSGRSG